MSKIIGIDLGTTNSCVAATEGGKPTVITNAESVGTTSSIVAFTKTGEGLIGRPAGRQVITNASKIISSTKRHMGTDYRADTDGREYTPQEISAMILQKLKTNVENHLGETITEAVITVPAYFNDAQRQTTKDTGKVVGLDVKRIINKPTMTTLTYGLDDKKEQEIMIYDLGGDTFDISIIKIGDDIIEVLSTNDDTRLGGDGFDNAITNWMISKFKKAEGVDLPNDKIALQELKGAAEKAKKKLSTATTTNINLPFIITTAEGPEHLDMNLTRAKFDGLTHNLVERTAIPIQNAPKDAGITASELGKVLLVGGSTRMIAAQGKVKQLTSKEPNRPLSPNECIAIGATTQSGKLTGDAGAGGILLLNITPLSLSTETTDGVATRLIERNATIPTKKNRIFSTAADNQTAVDIHVVQGGRQFARDNKTLGQFRLDGIPPTRRGIPQIEVTFDIDANGIVNVSARGLGTGKEQHITIASGPNMSDDDTDEAVKEAAKHEAQDKRRKEAIDARNGVDSMISRTEKALEEVGGKIVPGDKAEMEADLSSLKEAINQAPVEKMTDAQVEDIKANREKLMNSAQRLFAKVYEQAQASSAAGQAGPDMGGVGNTADSDDVADTDFKEV